MIKNAQEWGDFTEWLNRIHEGMECERADSMSVNAETKVAQSSLVRFLKSLHQWVKQVESAPLTTWRDELGVRGFVFPAETTLPDASITRQLWRLLHALGGMGIALTNTDHLCDRELYHLLVHDLLNRSVPQMSDGVSRSVVLDVVGLQVQEDPVPWLRYYASNRERMEWAKQNPGKGLPAPSETPYARDSQLPGR